MVKKKFYTKEEAEFLDFLNQQPEEYREMIGELGVKSFEELRALAAMVGIDMNKLEKFVQEHGDATLPSMEEVGFDEDDPDGDFSRRFMKSWNKEEDTDESEELDPFAMPEKIFFKELHASALHFRIKLKDAPVPVWREVEVPSNISLAFFAFVVIEAMGWMNEHLHQFIYKEHYYQNTASIKQNDDMFGIWGKNSKTYNTEKMPVSALFQEKGARIKFEYDFGDSWMHEIWLKGSREYAPDERPSIKILKGVGACPPEDCGGIWGYERLLALASKKRKSAEEKDELEWYGIFPEYDPKVFDLEICEGNFDCLWEDALSQ